MEPVYQLARQAVSVRDNATQHPELSPDDVLEMWLSSGRARVAALNTAEVSYVGNSEAATIQKQ